jgi:uncharacterized protein (TIGR00730 family)
MPKKPWLVKAYDNYEFLHSPAARNIRILTEMIEPAERLKANNVWNTVVFFGSARSKPMAQTKRKLAELERLAKKKKTLSAQFKSQLESARYAYKLSRYYNNAMQLAYKLTKWFGSPAMTDHNYYICSGGGPGMMEAANLGAKRAGGKSVGLNISLPLEQDPNHYQTRDISFEFHYFFIRKFWFFYLSKAMVFFPGGFGTFDELFELLTLVQTEKNKQYMPIILFGSEYWNDVFHVDVMERWGVISKNDKRHFKIVDTVDEAFDFLKSEIILHYIQTNKTKLWPIN